uniref:RRM domain-containing protein n=1 Tax=Caenorhabditis japonica TaxID=281687 RepID=A0A8R1IL01_CAEJA
MSYNYERGGYHGYNNRHRGGFHGPRINENQVPQSKHTIFIRGLPGEVTTEEIKEYIGERVGQISFDFVKQAQDRSKIFVAVRFEKREEAKEFMDT